MQTIVHGVFHFAAWVLVALSVEGLQRSIHAATSCSWSLGAPKADATVVCFEADETVTKRTKCPVRLQYSASRQGTLEKNHL